MYRDDRDARAENVQELRHDLGQAQVYNMAMRQALMAPVPIRHFGKQLYEVPHSIDYLQPGQRLALSHHNLKHFPVWALVMLHFVTFGIFSMVHFGAMHGRLPQASNDDPNAGKGVGFFFLPYFNLYWMFFSNLRLYDRLRLQYRLRGQQMSMSRGMVIAAAVFGIIPYINVLIGWPIMWLILAVQFQQAVNRLTELPPPAVAAGAQPGYAQPGYAQPGYAQPGYAQPGYAQPGYAQPG
ncbi:MAG TPA: hypothetical protein ENK23_02125, partial [Sorangium sp.]|nr:hypothetical protein [Sorangium sp.]